MHGVHSATEMWYLYIKLLTMWIHIHKQREMHTFIHFSTPVSHTIFVLLSYLLPGIRRHVEKNKSWKKKWQWHRAFPSMTAQLFLLREFGRGVRRFLLWSFMWRSYHHCTGATVSNTIIYTVCIAGPAHWFLMLSQWWEPYTHSL